MKTKEQIDEMIILLNESLTDGYYRAPMEIYPKEILDKFNAGELGLIPKQQDEIITFKQGLLWVLDKEEK